MLGNTFGWITYSILINDLFVFFGNAPGFLMAFWLNLQAAKMQYESFQSQEMRNLIVCELENRTSLCQSGTETPAAALDEDASIADDRDPEQQRKRQISETESIVRGVVAPKKFAPAPHETLVMLNVLVWLALVSLIGFALRLSDRAKETIIGVSVNLNLVVFYGAPLSTIWTVLTTQSSSSIHVRTMLTNTFNGIFWAAYGIAISDLFIAVPNSLGAALGAIQFVLCFLFPRREKVGDGENGSIAIEMEQTDTADSMKPAVDLATAERNGNR